MADHDLQTQEVTPLRFCDFELSFKPLELSRRGRPIELALQPLRLLALLVTRRGDLITHEEIRSHLWGGRTVSFNNSVHVYISQIRAALSDDAGTPRFIETVPRQGYRFLAAVRPPYRQQDAPKRSKIVLGWPGVRGWVGAATIALVIATALINHSFNASSPGPESIAAMDAYKRGIFLLEQRDAAASEKSLRYFDAALAADPGLAAAHSATARAYGRLGRFEEAGQRARQALTIDENLVDAYVVLGLVELLHEWAWDAAFDNFREALARDGDNAQAHQGIATYYVLLGDLDQGIAHMRRALIIDPASTIVRSDFGWFYYFAGDYGKAAKVCGEALDLAPQNKDALHCLIRSLALAGAHRSAADHMVTFMTKSDADDVDIEAISRRESSDALLEFEKWRLNHYEKSALDRSSSSAALAFAAASSGDFDRALAYADMALQERDPMIPFIAIDPVFKPLESHPRFLEMLKTLGLRET